MSQCVSQQRRRKMSSVDSRSFIDCHWSRKSSPSQRVLGSLLTLAVTLLAWMSVSSRVVGAEGRAWPALPASDGAVEIPAQEWPLRPGPRAVRVLVHYPRGTLESIGPRTGLMLTLHNWGGTDCVGTANPRELASELDVVALCVNYLQSGKADSIDGPEPYDFGYLQALDALRALAWTRTQLQGQGKTFADGRVYCTGGSGGGNVTLMAAKLAPRTFACVIDLCGMKRLTDDIAFNLPGGSGLNARYTRDPKHPYYLSVDEQELRFLAHRDHLRVQKSLNTTTRIVTVHGDEDATCPFPDAVEMVDAMRAAGIDVEPHYVSKADLDGKVFTSAGHSLGDRTRIVFQVAGKYLKLGEPGLLDRKSPGDFELREQIRFPTTNGEFVIDYREGFPVGRFESASSLPEYPARTSLLERRTAAGDVLPISKPQEWEQRRAHIVRHFQRVTGTLPNSASRVPLTVKNLEERREGALILRRITYQSDADDRVPAWLIFPASLLEMKSPSAPAVLCLHQTTGVGKDEPAGLAGDPTMKYARELAERGLVTLSPDYPSLGEHAYDFAPARGYVSGTLKAVWDNMRAVDVLESLSFVDGQRIGCIGHSLGGHNAIFSAVFDRRLKVIVSSCGFSTLAKDDIPSWTGPRYLPRLASEFGNDARRIPWDFPELVGCLAPRPFLAVAATRDNDFDVTGVRDALAAARPVYSLYEAADRLEGEYPEAPHSFPDASRRKAYEFLQKWLAR